ncbi:Fic family protein [Fulvivirgaceae bacterium BMA12]|uniref:Fic family protein n=1 Tax=Agaribacillus aureus TaxID=3051825 RepID=A0ABT8LCJ1_9BACT|nr:Fic family protein [Fulvivirgaceae bacterium BMA12]
MATPNEKIAESLTKLKALQDANIVAIKESDLTRVHKERLVKNGFIREVIRGWYISVPHDKVKGDSTSWFTSFWEFCSRYLANRYGKDYCISAEQSLAFHAGNTTVPKQLIIRSPKGNNLSTKLLFGTSIFVMRSSLPDEAEIEDTYGIRGLSLPSSIVYSTPSAFKNQATDVRTALLSIRDASELLGILLEGGHSKIAGRLSGAFRNIGRDKIADEILKTMKIAGYDVRENDPFDTESPISFEVREKSPYVNRIKIMWHEMRKKIIPVFPKAPGIPKDLKRYLNEIDEIYVTDAYHSLSIERYKVTPELIEKVQSGKWNTEKDEEDRKQKDAMAARGYWLAFKEVRKSLERILSLENPGKVADEDHGAWYRQLFAPSVTVGLLRPSDLAGYRNNQVYIAQSMHTPVNKDSVREAMPALFELLEEEKEPGVRAVLGHFMFVYIHPYMDGNGRIGRFLMNSMLISGGYPWTVIPVEHRDRYMKTLEAASVDQDISPFAEYIAHLVNEGLKGNPVAKVDQQSNIA